MIFKPKKLPYKDFEAIYSKVPRLCIDLVIQSGQGVLLSLRDIDPGKGLWHLPGGTLLMGEQIHQAVRRIAEEETGLSPGEARMIGTMEFPEDSNLFFHSVSIVYQLLTHTGELSGSFQGQELGFFEDLPQKTIPEHKKFLLEHVL